MAKREKKPERRKLEDGYIHDRSETYTETYKRLTKLKLWSAYRQEQEQLTKNGLEPGVIEEHMWNRYSPNALLERKLVSKERKEEAGLLEGVNQDDLHWVFTNIDQNNKTFIETAPSIGAMSLLERAKRDTKIYQWVLDHITPKTFVESGGTTWESDKARSLTGIGRQLTEAFYAKRTQLLSAQGTGREEPSGEPATA